MPTWVKICGITNHADAELAIALGADALGFVFHRPSPRYIAPAQARAMVSSLRGKTLTVGVWLKEQQSQTQFDLVASGVDCCQVYDAGVAARLIADRHSVIFATDPLSARFSTTRPGLDAPSVLLDCGRESHDTPHQIQEARISNALAAIVKATPDLRAFENRKSKTENPPRLILAGGLTPENVFDRLFAVKSRGIGVDVASGVESAPGKKDPDKLNRFFEGVRKWDATAGSAGSADDLSPKP